MIRKLYKNNFNIKETYTTSVGNIRKCNSDVDDAVEIHAISKYII